MSGENAISIQRRPMSEGLHWPADNYATGRNTHARRAEATICLSGARARVFRC